MELKTESMKNMKKAVEKCLDDLMKKTDLTPGETKAAVDGFKLYDELCCRIEDCEMEQEYSGREFPRQHYHMTSYGMPERAYNRMSHEPHYNSMRSYCGDPYYYGQDYSESRGHGYSRHSISDRVVSMVEKMMDSADSDYERQELQKYIRAIRAMGMTD